jgi:uncharacterized repeat protein (TIGR03803 family)
MVKKLKQESRPLGVAGLLMVLFSVIGPPLAQANGYKVLYNFTGMTDGSYPEAPLISDSEGNFYGTTYKGGTAGLGVVFKVDAAGTGRCCTTLWGERTERGLTQV